MKYKSLIILSYFWLQTLNQVQKPCNLYYYFFSLARFWRSKNPSKSFHFRISIYNSLFGEFLTITITCCWNIYSLDGTVQIISVFQIYQMSPKRQTISVFQCAWGAVCQDSWFRRW
jgi:hypothetical protein